MESSQNPKKISKKSMLIGIIVLIGIVLLAFWTIFKNLSGTDIINTLRHISPLVIVLGLVAMLMFSFFEGLNMYRALKLSGYHVNLWQSWRYAIIGFFYSGITPSSSGGQPMQLYYMYQDGIKVSHGLSAVILQLFGHEGANATFGLLGFIIMYKSLAPNIRQLKYLVILGIIINVAYFLFLTVCLFSKRGIDIVRGALISIVSKFGGKNGNKIVDKVVGVLDDYGNVYEILKQDRHLPWKTYLTGLLQFLCMYAVTFIVYRGLGYSDYGLLATELLQATIFISVGFIPLPGSAGVSEGMAYLVYKILYPVTAIGGAVLLVRCLNMYFVLILYGIILLVTGRLLRRMISGTK